MHIILDLDETLINSCEPETNFNFEYFFINQPNSQIPEFKTYIRPHCKEFLQWLFQNVSVSFWSSGEKSYVLDIIKHLVTKENQKKIKCILWRDQCEESEKCTGQIKNIDWFKKILSRFEKDGKIILIDDLDENIFANPQNSIQIKPFDASQNNISDNELVRILDLLKLELGRENRPI